MDGLLVVDKPSGPTSHDIVARVRRALGEKSIGHTGTLDPLASGVLALVVGRATRLARFLSSSDKTYVATIHLGVSTDTYDAIGHPTGAPYQGELPSPAVIDRALDRFRGTFLQQPPAFSAKRIDGRRSHRLARAHARASRLSEFPAVDTAMPPPPQAGPVLPAPARVTARALELLEVNGHLVTLRVVCSAGFYVRALAHDLGVVLGVGAHVSALRRTESAGRGIASAVTLEDVENREHGRARALAALVPLADVLPGIPRLEVTEEGARRVATGRDLGPGHVVSPFPDGQQAADEREWFRLFDPAGRLLCLAKPATTTGLLHPAVVLM